MITATRRIQFCAGHRVFKHESKCNNLHGHNYVVFITAYGKDSSLDRLGRVIDFSVLKDKVGTWIDFNWDHGFLYSREDEEVGRVLIQLGHKRFLLPYNPTAENLARYLLEIGNILLEPDGVGISKVTVHETENCIAEYVP